MLIPKDEVRNRYKNQLQRGIEGKNIGLALDSSQYARLTKYIANIQRGRYDLIGAPTGCGKSSLLLDMYMENPIRYVENHSEENITLRILYFNIELPVENVLAKFVARRTFQETGKILSINKIFQKGEYANPEEIELINKYSDQFQLLLKYTNFYEGSITPDYIFKTVMENLKELGTFTPIFDEKGNQVYETYEYHNPNTYVICLVDHLGLLKPNKSKQESISKKATMDALVNNYVIPTRNSYGITWALCQQMNRANEDPGRLKSKIGPEPMIGDFMYSSEPPQGADTVIGLYKPQSFGVDKYMGYEIQKMKKYFLSAKILKNRDGPADVVDHFGFMGAVGYLKEIPYAHEIGKNGHPTLEKISSHFLS